MADAVELKPGRDKAIRNGHPWIFSGSVRALPAEIEDGEVVDVRAHDGQWLARGYLNRRSQIQVRLLTWRAEETIDADFWMQRLKRANEQRRALDLGDTSAYRLVNGENDYLPGLVVDRYDHWLVLQAGTLGIERRKTLLAEQLLSLTGCRGVLERSDLSVRRLEGLDETTGTLAGEAPPDIVTIREHGIRFRVDLQGGQKTGFYTDQRENRRRVATYCDGKRILNAFAYTGAFGVYALAAGATHVTNVDTSLEALEMGEENLRLNGFDPDDQAAGVAGDVFEILGDWSQNGEPPFDLIVLDPPKFATHRRAVEAALRGYKEINRLALHLLPPGGMLATFSCSGLVSEDLFQKVLFGAAHDARRRVQVLEWMRQGPDHPLALTFPEGAYLKGLLCRVVD